MIFRFMILVSLAGAALSACGGDDSGSNGSQPAQAVPTVNIDGGAPASSSPQSTGAAPSTGQTGGGVPAGGGQATLTVGDQSWTFEGVYCAFGPEQTRNDRVSFSSGAFGEVEGTRVQLDASIQDPQQQGRYEGGGVIHSVTLNDIQDFQNPSIGWEAVSGFGGASEFVFTIDGKSIRVEATFDDSTSDELENLPGTLEMTCP
jgi:hypothetical protein